MEELIVQTSRALVIGIGGGGDVIGAIPTRSYLEFLGVETVLGGLTWERKVSDPQPGPRGIKELEGVEQLNEYSALARAGASIKGGEKERVRWPGFWRRMSSSWISMEGWKVPLGPWKMLPRSWGWTSS